MTTCVTNVTVMTSFVEKQWLLQILIRKIVESSCLAAREHLAEWSEISLTPVKGQFLCPQRCNKLNEPVRFRKSLDAFFASTCITLCVGRKRSSTEAGTSPILKRPRFSSTPNVNILLIKQFIERLLIKIENLLPYWR